MLAGNRLNAEIPSPSLHLIGSDAGLRAAVSTPLFSSFAVDGHLQGYNQASTGRYDYDREKLLPDIPVAAAAAAHTHTALPGMADGQAAQIPMHSRSPVNQVVRLFTTSNSARVRPLIFGQGQGASSRRKLCSLIFHRAHMLQKPSRIPR